jgi:kinesin family member 2/24
MCADHDSLIKQILEEEEDFISAHRQHIDQVVEVVKVDMTLLQTVD